MHLRGIKNSGFELGFLEYYFHGQLIHKTWNKNKRPIRPVKHGFLFIFVFQGLKRQKNVDF